MTKVVKASSKNSYFCESCGANHTKWSGKCSSCGAWNSIVEQPFKSAPEAFTGFNIGQDSLNSSSSLELKLLRGELDEINRTSTGIKQLDDVLGGGFVTGMTILISGEPGIGKSTLLLQVACCIQNAGVKTFYFSGEESVNQIRMRGSRMLLSETQLYLASTNSVLEVINALQTHEDVKAIVIDSIQTMCLPNMESASGTVSQIKACTQILINYCKTRDIVLIIVGHVTKDGQIAGPKLLEHMVDTVLYFESDIGGSYRLLRSTKNRFGCVNEIAIFEMHSSGIRAIENASEIFINTNSRTGECVGRSTFATTEGSKSILTNIEALITPSYMSMPRRSVVGWDNNRLAMLLAILGSKCGLNLSDKEVYVAIAGGLKVNEPAADLAVAAAIISCMKNKPINTQAVFLGEVSLLGQVRAVSRLEARIKESVRLKFSTIYTPKLTKETLSSIKSTLQDANIVEVLDVKKLQDLL